MKCVSVVVLLAIGACAAGAAESPASIAAKRRAMGKLPSFGGVVPRSNEPGGELVVLRIWPDDVDMRIAVAALQGLVNREKPRLYIGIDKPLRWLEYYSGKTITKIEPDIYKVFERFKGYAKGLVVYDYSVDALPNLAITYAGIEDLIPADPELAQDLSARFGWKVVHDLRGKWKTRCEAYKWAYENLFPRCEKRLLIHYNHGYKTREPDPFGMDGETLKTGHLVDYAVEFRAFCWHVPTEPTDDEVALAEQIMQSVPFHTPILGRSSTQDCFPEPAFVSWVAEFANLHIPAGMGNTSVLSGARIPEEMLRQKELPVTHDMGPDKVYVAFTNSEKDNLEHVIGGGPPWHRLGMETDDPYKIWWSDPWRGRVPIGWPLCPLIADFAPTTLAEFMTTKTDNDYFMAALSGLCLSDPETYGMRYPEIQDQLLDEYCKLTGEYMKHLGWTQAQPVGTPAILRHFAGNIPFMTGMMEGYGVHRGMSYEKANYVLDGVPVFHALTEGTFGTSRERPLSEVNQAKAKAFAKEITSIKVTERPAFIHAWNVGWDFGPTTLKMTADLLPPDYVVVRPDELAALFMKYRHDNPAGGVSDAAEPSTGRVTETPAENGLIVDTGRIAVEIAWGSEASAPVKRVRGVDGKWRCTGVLILNNPRHLKAESLTCRKTLDTDNQKRYELVYGFGEDRTVRFVLTATAGKPYILVQENSAGSNIPSWGLDAFPDFRPDTLYSDCDTRPLDYKGSHSMGSLPWYHWMLACKKDGPERDLIGVLVASLPDWANATAIFWQRETGAYWEFYHDRNGGRKYAIVALDRGDADAPKRVWEELKR